MQTLEDDTAEQQRRVQSLEVEHCDEEKEGKHETLVIYTYNYIYIYIPVVSLSLYIYIYTQYILYIRSIFLFIRPEKGV